MEYLFGFMFGIGLMFSVIATPIIFIQKIINKNWKFSKFEVAVFVFGVLGILLLVNPFI